MMLLEASAAEMPTSSLLETLLVSHWGRFAALADAWLAAGATALSLCGNHRVLVHWPGGSLPPTTLAAPIRCGRQVVGELCLAGLSGGPAQARLTADAELISHLLSVEDELENMAGELVHAQDQLLAIYDLAQSMRGQLDIEESLQALASYAARLVHTRGAFAVLATANEQIKVAQVPAPLLDESLLLELFSQMQASKRPVLLNTPDQSHLLPGTIESFLLAPIQVDGKLIAGLGLLNKVEGDFTSPDLKLVQAICEQAGARIENVLLHQERLSRARLQTEMELAKDVQTRLLPKQLPKVPGLDLFAASRPAFQVGGDFYDLIFQKRRPFLFTVGDVAGKGMPAALLMAMTRTIMRNVASSLPVLSPEDVLRRSTESLYDDFTEVGMFSTVFVGQYHPNTRQLIYANAGHSPVIYCPAGSPASMLEADGAPLGVLPVSLSENQHLTLNVGDVLIVATDGFSEARDGADEMFGYERLLALTESLADYGAAQIGTALFETISSFSLGNDQDDDQTLLVVKGVGP
jgi:sigma-B regulation protein RsbU (phosphoserine phosphatase)